MQDKMAPHLEIKDILREKFDAATVRLWCDVIRGYHANEKLPDQRRMLSYFEQKCTERNVHNDFVSNKQSHGMICGNLEKDVSVARAAKSKLRTTHSYNIHYKPIIALEKLICEYNQCSNKIMCFGWDKKTQERLETLAAQIVFQKRQVLSIQH